MTKLNKIFSLGDCFIKIFQELVVVDSLLEAAQAASFLVDPRGVAFREVVASLVVASLQEAAYEMVKLQGVVELLVVVASFHGVGVVTFQTFQGVACGEPVLVVLRCQLDMQQL